jgi:hypothetical protein
MKTALLVLTLFILSSPLVHAKDLTHRLGIGFSNQFTTMDLPSITAKYYPQAELGFAVNLGVLTEENNSRFGLSVKMMRVIFPEDHMNFYMGASAGLLSSKIATVSNSGFELTGFCGGEFFLPNLESLGISFEAGVGISSVSNGVSFRTIADHPLRAGMVFYF